MCSINLANSATMPIVANGANNGSSKSSGVRRMTVQVSDKFGPTVNSAKFSGGGAGSQYTQSTFSTRGETAKKLSPAPFCFLFIGSFCCSIGLQKDQLRITDTATWKPHSFQIVRTIELAHKIG